MMIQNFGKPIQKLCYQVFIRVHYFNNVTISPLIGFIKKNSNLTLMSHCMYLLYFIPLYFINMLWNSVLINPQNVTRSTSRWRIVLYFHLPASNLPPNRSRTYWYLPRAAKSRHYTERAASVRIIYIICQCVHFQNFVIDAIMLQ